MHSTCIAQLKCVGLHWAHSLRSSYLKSHLVINLDLKVKISQKIS